MPRRRSLDRFGRMAVGQRIRFERNCVLPPVTDPVEYWRGALDWDLDLPLVTLTAEGCIVRLEQGYFDAFVTMRLDDGREITCTFDAYGMEPGGWDRLHVLQEAPSQRSLIREAA